MTKEPKLVSVTDLRDNLSHAFDQAKKDKAMLVTKNGIPYTALVDIDFFEDLLSLANSEYLESIKEARRDAKSGHLLNHEQVFGRF